MLIHTAKYRRLRSCLKTAVLFALTALGPAQALADEDDVFNFIGGAEVRYEDNLFRLPDRGQPGVGSDLHKSDMLYSVSAGFSIDKPYAQQRFQLEALATDNKFRSNSFLDYTGIDYRAAWLWHLTPDISGILLFDQQQALSNFADFRNSTSRNIQTSNNRIFNADARITGGWHVTGGVLQIRSRNSEVFPEVGDYVQNGVELGGKYISRANNSVTLVRRESDGEYSGRSLDPVLALDSGFKQSELEARVDWRLTGKSRVDAKLGYLDREHDNFSSRDYSGAVGRFAYEWKPTGKLELNVALSRNLFSFQEVINSYYVADTLTFAPVWNITAKTRLRARYDYSERDYRGPITQGVRTRDDIAQLFLLSAEWQARRSVLLSANLERQTRDSNLRNFDYDANAVYLTTQIMF